MAYGGGLVGVEVEVERGIGEVAGVDGFVGLAQFFEVLGNGADVSPFGGFVDPGLENVPDAKADHKEHSEDGDGEAYWSRCMA